MIAADHHDRHLGVQIAGQILGERQEFRYLALEVVPDAEILVGPDIGIGGEIEERLDIVGDRSELVQLGLPAQEHDVRVGQHVEPALELLHGGAERPDGEGEVVAQPRLGQAGEADMPGPAAAGRGQRDAPRRFQKEALGRLGLG